MPRNFYLTRAMRDVLIEHLDGREVRLVVGDSHRQKTMASLLDRGMVRPSHLRQRHTVITEPGRIALAKALADWAEALVRAGHSAESPAAAFLALVTPLETGPSEARTFPVDSI